MILANFIMIFIKKYTLLSILHLLLVISGTIQRDSCMYLPKLTNEVLLFHF
jgi:hypothetical protein